MKPPVTIEQLTEMWSKDSIMDETEPGRELMKIPILHSKYLTIMSYHNMIVRKLMGDYNKKRLLLTQYWCGDLNNDEDLATIGREPVMKKILRQDIPMYLDSDQELIDILLRKIYNEEIVAYCTSVLRELNSRTYQLRAFVDWEKFTGGPGNG
tara:strand:- start:14712 stop:15170 length:459 start_codon:yes stop_codon:yes gene_type:complete